MWMIESESVVAEKVHIPEYPMMRAADEVARRAVQHDIVNKIVFTAKLGDYMGAIYKRDNQAIRLGVFDCATPLPIALAHEIAHAIDDYTGYSLSGAMDVEGIREPRQLYAETYHRACLDPRWVESHIEDTSHLCHDMRRYDVPDSLIPTWHLTGTPDFF